MMGQEIQIYSNIFKEWYKIQNIEDLSVSNGDNECITVEIENKTSKNLLIIDCQVVLLKDLMAF